MIATVLHVTSGLGHRKFQANGFLLTRVYHAYFIISCCDQHQWNTSHSSTHTQTQYILGQHDSSINIKIVYTATTQTGLMIIGAT